MNIDTTYFLKGFAQNVEHDRLWKPEECEGEFYAVVTDMIETNYIKITAAHKDGDAWVVTCSDGSIKTFFMEPENPRYMKSATLLKNKSQGCFGVVLCADYEEVMRDIANGSHNYHLRGCVQEEKVLTSFLIKFWIDAEGKHGITMTGSHYIF